MSRCRCCDVPMTLRDFRMKQDDDTDEDMCSQCLSIVYSPDFCDSKSYQFEELTEKFYSEQITLFKRMND